MVRIGGRKGGGHNLMGPECSLHRHRAQRDVAHLQRNSRNFFARDMAFPLRPRRADRFLWPEIRAGSVMAATFSTTRRNPVPVTLMALAVLVLLAGCVVVPIPLPLPSGQCSSAEFTTRTTTRTVAAAPVAPAGPARLPAGCTRPGHADATEDRVLALVNAFRAEHGLSRLRASARLATVAQGHACDNAARGSISHTGANGSGLSERLKRGGYRLRTAAENPGRGFVDDPDRMVAVWKSSPGHRENLLNPEMTEAGLGLTSGSRPAWVLNLGAPR